MDKKKKNISEKQNGKTAPTQKITMPPSHEDPLGSYTGVPTTPGEVPTQDADDL